MVGRNQLGRSQQALRSRQEIVTLIDLQTSSRRRGRPQWAPLSHLATQCCALLKKLLINFLDVEGVFNPAAYIVSNH